MRIALAQIETAVGDLEGNARRIVGAIEEARRARADLVAVPELAVPGYPPLDLLLEPGFVEENRRVLLEGIAPAAKGIVALVGFVDEDASRKTPAGTPVRYNAAAVLAEGRLAGISRKTLLPGYDVFFEPRYFAPAASRVAHDVAGTRLGVEICEDMWEEGYGCAVGRELAAAGARVLVNLSASPFTVGKPAARIELARKRAREADRPLLYVNAVGSEDGYEGQLVFDGSSFAVDRKGNLLALGKSFEEDLLVVEIDPERGEGPPIAARPSSPVEELAGALVLGMRIYARRNGFRSAVLGLSGGVDSALTACLAVEAFGREGVRALWMPSRFSSERSARDAAAVARNLGIGLRAVPIEEAFETVRRTLGPEFEGADLALENVQARLRGLFLMADSNRSGHLLLSTGNKTELALGYCTLYGDMAGGLAPLADVSKREVYALAEKRKEIPASILRAAPTAELRADQVDPFDYAVVSPLVDALVEGRRTPEDLVREGYDRAVVEDCVCRLRAAEYKRRQAPPGIKVTGTAFGVGRRVPIAHSFRGPGRSA